MQYERNPFDHNGGDYKMQQLLCSSEVLSRLYYCKTGEKGSHVAGREGGWSERVQLWTIVEESSILAC